MRKSGRILLSLLAAATVAGCASGQGDVNRVQPNYWPKSQFQGEWYFRDTVIDVPYENATLFEGLPSSMEKIRWEIQENALIAYRVNEHVLGANGTPDSGKPEFEVVAAWAIDRHFDIVRDYNPATGEQTNVLVENAVDRPWWDREYIRVDWSRNIVSNYSALQPVLSFYTEASGADYWVQGFEEANPDRVEIQKDYIGVVGKYNMLADPFACFNMVEFFFGNGDTNACLPTTVKVRSSFVKIDPDRPRMQPLAYPDREPLAADLDGDHVVESEEQLGKVLQICTSATPQGECETDQEGLPLTTYVECTQDVIDALNADPYYSRYRYTMADCGLPQDAQALYFEKFGFFRTERPAYSRDYGHLEKNRVLLANRWKIWESDYDKDGMPLPYAQRKPKAIVYYLNPDFPEDLYAEAFEIGRQFNDAFRGTVAGLQGTGVNDPAFANLTMFEVRPNSCSRENVRKFVKQHKLEDVVERVIGSVENLDFSNLERVCSALEYNSDFAWQKNGDLRYSFLYWVNRPQMAGPLGFGPSFADPETGEIINGTAYVYGAGVDSYAAFATDIVQVMRGQQNLDDVITGDNMRAIVAFGQQRDAANRALLAAEREDLSRRARDFELRGGQGGPAGFGGGAPPSKQELFAMLRAEAGHRFGVMPEGFEKSRQDLMASAPDILHATTDHEGLLLAGWRPGQEPTDDQIRRASIVGIHDRQQKFEAYVQKLTGGEHCLMMEAFTDPSIIGLALEYDAGNKTREQVYQELRARIFRGVTLHEVGHTVGLRHNFSGSYDALNYFDRFWDIRSQYQDSIEQTLQNGLATGDDKAKLEACVERAQALGMEPPTSVECLRGPEYKMSSIMDYGARFNSDFAGLGKYDHAAIRFGYGQLVDVFEDSVGVSPDLASLNLFYLSYKKIPDWLGGRDNINARKVMSYTDLVKQRLQDIRGRAANLPVLDAATGRCTANCDTFARGGTEVPYMFCSDEYANWEGRDCKRWDEGASQEEIVDSAITRYETFYPFSAFRRGRVNWNPNGWLNTLGGRVLNHFTRAYQFYLYYGNRLERWDVGIDLANASIKGLNKMGEIMEQPEDGWYCQEPDTGDFVNQRYWRFNYDCNSRTTQTEKVYMPLGLGKPHWAQFGNNYYLNYNAIGAAYEKRVTLSALTINSAQFFGIDNLDVRRFALSYYQLYRPEMVDLMNGLITGDYRKYAGTVNRVDGELVYVPRRVVNPDSAPGNGTTTLGALKPANTEDYALQLDTAAYGSLYLASPIDGSLDFTNYLKASVMGSWDDLDWGNIDRNDPNVYVEMEDPTTRRTYTAVNSVDGLSITHQLLTEAKDFKVRFWEPAKARLEAATPGTTEYSDAQNAMRNAEAQFRYRLELIDWTRRLNRLVELGT